MRIIINSIPRLFRRRFCRPTRPLPSNKSCLQRLMRQGLSLPPPRQLVFPSALLPSLGLAAVGCLRVPLSPAEPLGLALEPQFFRAFLRMRLRLPIAASEGYCPCTMGSWTVMATMLSCGEDRIKRRSRLWTVLAARAAAADFAPEVEKAGLLPARLPRALFLRGWCRGSGPTIRRYLRASWGPYGLAAFDLAVTNGRLPTQSMTPRSALHMRNASASANGRPVQGAGHSIRALRR